MTLLSPGRIKAIPQPAQFSKLTTKFADREDAMLSHRTWRFAYLERESQ